MGGIYFDIWSCSDCEYTSRTVSGPFRVEPSEGTPEAAIEYRWCNNCNEIQRVFTAKGAIVIPGREPNSKIDRWEFRTMDDFNTAVKKLEKKKKWNIFFFLTSNYKKLKNYYESKKICEKISSENQAFYESIKSKATCLNCNSVDVSEHSYESDRHKCGGQFVCTGSGRKGSVGTYEVITYNADGTSNSEMRDMR
jgi:CTP synthase (UTP-ammonia lyase)